MRTRIIKIGNSQGIRIPKLLLRQAGLGEEVDLEVHQGHIAIRPAHHPRQGWEVQFNEMAKHSDDRLLDAETPSLTQWDEDEWEW